MFTVNVGKSYLDELGCETSDGLLCCSFVGTVVFVLVAFFAVVWIFCRWDCSWRCRFSGGV